MKNKTTIKLLIIVILTALFVGLVWVAVGADITQAAPPDRPLYAPGDCTVTTVAYSGPGSLEECILGLQPGATITFSTSVFPPGSPAIIALVDALPDIITNNVTIDGSNAGVILDGSGIGATPETLLLDDVSLTIDGGPNLLANGSFTSGQEHWRPYDSDPGEATRAINGSDYVSSPSSYQWGVTAHAGEGSRTLYDTTNTSAPFTDWPFGDESTVWIPAIGDSTAEVRLRHKQDGGGLGITLWVQYSDGYSERIAEWGTNFESSWPAEAAVFTQTLPAGITAVALELSFGHSEGLVSGLNIRSNDNTIRGLQIVDFPWCGINIQDGAQNNTIGGDRGTGAGPLGQGNLLSGNDRGILGTTTATTITGNYIGTDVTGTTAWGNSSYGIQLGGNNNRISNNLISGNREGILLHGGSTMSNTIGGNFIGTDATGQNALSNDESGISLGGDGTSYNIIGGNNGTPGGACSGDCNLISGNNKDGINIQNSSTVSNTVSGNYIGTNISGTTAIPNEDGIWIEDGASFNVIGGNTPGTRNLISGNNWEGIRIKDYGTMYNTVMGNYIGTDVSGTLDLGNTDDGIEIKDGASYNLIGGDTSGEGNLISGNGCSGVHLTDSGTNYNTISGNFIGTDAGGTFAIGQGGEDCGNDGVSIWDGASFNVVGGDTPGERNLISGNGTHGVRVWGSGSYSNTISGNFIGTNITGTGIISNTNHGVQLGSGAAYNVIGGDTPGERNIISGNHGGIVMYSAFGFSVNYNKVIGNYIGTDVSGVNNLGNEAFGIGLGGDGQANTYHNRIGGSTPGERNVISFNQGEGIGIFNNKALYNTIRQNSIYSNAEQGINLESGGNQELFPPILTDVSHNAVSGQAPPNSTVEIFSDAENEGRYYHGTTVANAAGSFTYSQAGVFTGTKVTATATDSGGNTSEFSAPYQPLVDAKVVAILQPKSSGAVGDTVTPKIKVGNAGTTVGTITLTVEAVGTALAAPYGPHQQTVDLPSLGSATLSFPQFTPVVSDTYVYTASVSLAGDQDSSNDALAQAVNTTEYVVDLWTRDNDTDTGNLPVNPFWKSPDIWVRHNQDGVIEHQNPISGTTNYIYMIVRNRGTAASSGTDTAKVYWHEPSLGIKCAAWTEIATQTVSTIPETNGTQTLVFEWTPTRDGHTCLYSEIISADDPVVNECDVPWDNNLSQRNMEIVPGAAAITSIQEIGALAAGAITFEVTNIKDAPKPIDIIVDASNVPDTGDTFVRLDLGNELANRWIAVDGYSNPHSSNITWSGGSIITVTNAATGTIAGIPMEAGETQVVTLTVNAPSVDTTTVTVYEAIDAGPGVAVVDAIVGGNTYIFNTESTADENVYLPVVLKND